MTRTADGATLEPIRVMRRTCVVLVALGMIAPGLANAAWLPPLRRAEQAAVQFWHRTPCHRRIVVRYDPPELAPSNYTGGVAVEHIWAWVTFSAASLTEPRTYTDCVLNINDQYFSPRQQRRHFPLFCALVVHEFGHFMGHLDHSGYRRTSIEYPIIGPANMNITPCFERSMQPRSTQRERRSSVVGQFEMSSAAISRSVQT